MYFIVFSQPQYSGDIELGKKNHLGTPTITLVNWYESVAGLLLSSSTFFSGMEHFCDMRSADIYSLLLEMGVFEQ